MKQLHDQIIELHQARKWEEYDKTQEQIQVLAGRCPELRDTHYHEQCVRLRVCSHGKRKDPHQFLRALGIHRGIDLQKTFGDNEQIGWRYMNILCYCFVVGLAGEGFSLMGRMN